MISEFSRNNLCLLLSSNSYSTNGLLYSKVEVEQRTHSDDDVMQLYINLNKDLEPMLLNSDKITVR